MFSVLVSLGKIKQFWNLFKGPLRSIEGVQLDIKVSWGSKSILTSNKTSEEAYKKKQTKRYSKVLFLVWAYLLYLLIGRKY